MSVLTVSRLSKLGSSGLSRLYCFTACGTLDSQSPAGPSPPYRHQKESLSPANCRLNTSKKKTDWECQINEVRPLGTATVSDPHLPAAEFPPAQVSETVLSIPIILLPSSHAVTMILSFFCPSILYFVLFWCLVFWLSPHCPLSPQPVLHFGSWVNVLISSSFQGVPIEELDAIVWILVLAEF